MGGQLGGGMAAQGEHQFFARALTDSVVLRIREEDWFDVMEDHFDVARSAFRYMATERGRVMLAGTTREAERASEPPVSVRP